MFRSDNFAEVPVPLSSEDVRALVAAFDDSDWDEMTLTIDGTRLVLSRSGRPPALAGGQEAAAPTASATVAAATGIGTAAPAAPGTVAAAPTAGRAGDAAPAAAPPPGTTGAPAGSAESAARAVGGHRITAPSVGLFWRSPKPGAPPFVEAGDEVGPDDTVCIVEVMKLMNHVRAGVAGTVLAIHPENGEMVEHGQPLFTIELAR